MIPDSPVVYQRVPADGFELEGDRVVAVEVGHTDTDRTTVLHVPSIGLVVAGDVAYNGVHQYLPESAAGGIDAWLKAIILEQTRHYLLDARRLLADKPSPRELYDQMLALYPDRLNAGPLWYGALGLLS